MRNKALSHHVNVGDAVFHRHFGMGRVTDVRRDHHGGSALYTVVRTGAVCGPIITPVRDALLVQFADWNETYTWMDSADIAMHVPRT